MLEENNIKKNNTQTEQYKRQVSVPALVLRTYNNGTYNDQDIIKIFQLD
jgi:hypothetical protein